MHWAQPCHAPCRPSPPTVPRGFPEGLLRGTLGGEEQRCLGAVRHQTPPRVSAGTGGGAVNTANSMINEGTRVQWTCALCAWCPPLSQPMRALSRIRWQWFSGTAANEYRGLAKAMRGATEYERGSCTRAAPGHGRLSARAALRIFGGASESEHVQTLSVF
jgi:hypothetical protein